jgi:hypothetical protein
VSHLFSVILYTNPPPSLFQPCHGCTSSAPWSTVLLGNGHSITFTAQDVPPPPTTTFTDNIPRLNGMWDDTSMYWDRDSVLRILGQPIALVYWPIVYTRWRAGDWDTLKTQFGHWKVCLLIYSLFFFFFTLLLLFIFSRQSSSAIMKAQRRSSGPSSRMQKAGTCPSQQLSLA